MKNEKSPINIHIDLSDSVNSSLEDIFEKISSKFGQICKHNLRVEKIICHPDDKQLLIAVNQYSHQKIGITIENHLDFWGASYVLDIRLKKSNIILTSS